MTQTSIFRGMCNFQSDLSKSYFKRTCMLLQTRKLAHRKRDKTIWLGAVLAAIPDKVTVTVQLHIDILELLRQQSLCANTHQPSSSVHFASAAVTVASSHMTASSSASWSRFSPPSNFVSGHMSTMWLMVCHWPQSQEGDWARPHLCKFARHRP